MPKRNSLTSRTCAPQEQTIIDAIKEMLITKVIEAGIKWLLSLLIPGAGFIKAIMAIKDIVVFFVETAIMLIPAITEAILALASGSVAGVAKAFEFGLSKLIVLVIGLFAKLIGLGDLAKRVQKIFKKIRKRVDKVVRDLFKKAKRAGRKLMRKLGIGKKKKKKRGDADDRTPAEMQADLKKGIQEATMFVKGGETDKKKIKKRFDKIDKKYDLVELKLVVDKQNPEGKEQVHVHGEVNPVGDGEKIEIEMDADRKVSLPPKGYAYFLRQHGPRRHFKVILWNGALIHLASGNGTVEILYEPDQFKNAAKSKDKNPPKVIKIETPGEGKEENFIALKVKEDNLSASKLDKIVEDFNGRTYGDGYHKDYDGMKEKDKPVDCFKFAVDLLNGAIENDNNKLKPEGDDNDPRYDSLLSKSQAILKRSKK